MVDRDLRFTVFSGAALVAAAHHEHDPSYVVVDGTATVDSLGSAGPLDFQWRVRELDGVTPDLDSDLVILGHGARTAVPRLIWDYFFPGSHKKNYLCLKVTDVDRHSDEQCILPGTKPGVPPPVGVPDCR